VDGWENVRVHACVCVCVCACVCMCGFVYKYFGMCGRLTILGK